MAKYEDVVEVRDGVKYTYCAPRKPRKGELTYDVSKSKYSVWQQGAKSCAIGSRGCKGTAPDC